MGCFFLLLLFIMAGRPSFHGRPVLPAEVEIGGSNVLADRAYGAKTIRAYISEQGAFHIRICGQCAKYGFQCTIIPPFSESGIHRLPGIICLWQFPPLRREMKRAQWIDIRSDRQKGLSYMNPRTAKRYAESPQKPEYTLGHV